MQQKCPFQFDLMNPAKMSEEVPFAAFQTLREQCPVALQEATDHSAEFWAITKRDDVDFISKNPGKFSSSVNLAHPQPGGADPASLEIMRQLIINMDPPVHTQYRKVVKNAFTMHAVDAFEPMMREYAKEIIDKIAARGHCEFAGEVAAEMPLFVICALTEMPADKRRIFSDLVDIMIGMDDPEMGVTAESGQMAATQIFDIAMELAASHKANPKEGTVLDALLNGVVEGEALTEFEFCTFFLILIAGGVETTRTATNHGMRLLIEHPDQLQKLVDDPSLIPGAVEEILQVEIVGKLIDALAHRKTPSGDVARDIDPVAVNSSTIRLRTAAGELPVGEFFTNGNQVEFVPTLLVSGGQTFFGFRPGEVYTLTIPGGANVETLRSTSGFPFTDTFTCSLIASQGIQDLNGVPPSADLVSPTVSQLGSASAVGWKAKQNCEIVLPELVQIQPGVHYAPPSMTWL